MSQVSASKWKFQSASPSSFKHSSKSRQKGFLPPLNSLNNILSGTESKKPPMDSRISPPHIDQEVISDSNNKSSHPVASVEEAKVDDKKNSIQKSPKQKNPNQHTLKQRNAKQKEIKEKDKRRSRNDPIGRDFKCGCGKKYLSYPALFTHIRQKHGGKEIEGTLKTLPGANTKRGRPKKTADESLASERSDKSDKSEKGEKSEKNEKNEKNESHEKNEKELIEIADDQPVYKESSQNSTSQKTHLLPFDKVKMFTFSEYYDIMQGSTIVDKSLTFPTFISVIKTLNQQQGKIIDQSVTIDQIFSIFLFNMADETNPTFFQLLQEIFIAFRTCLNQNYSCMVQPPKFIPQVFKCQLIQPPENYDKQYSSTHNCQLLPLVCQYFIIEHAPRHLKKIQPTLLSSIIHDFCIWLDLHKLTRIRVFREPSNLKLVKRNIEEEEYYDYFER